MSNFFNIIYQQLKQIILPVSLSGKKPVEFNGKNLNIPEFCIFELKLLVDFLFYGYIIFNISAHFIDPRYVWFYFNDYLFGVFWFIGMTILFNFLIRKYRKNRKL